MKLTSNRMTPSLKAILALPLLLFGVASHTSMTQSPVPSQPPARTPWRERARVFTTTLLADGRALIYGDAAFPMSFYVQRTELYDPRAGTFSLTDPLFTRWMDAFTATLLTNGKVSQPTSPTS